MSSHENLVARSVTGIMATAATYPIEILKTIKHLRKRKEKHGLQRYSKINIKKQGFKGFFKVKKLWCIKIYLL